MLAIAAMLTWRAYRRASRRGTELSTYTTEQALEIARLSEQLSQHGFQLEHTAAELGPKIERIATFLEQPLVAAAFPWLLRRLLVRPYRRR